MDALVAKRFPDLSFDLNKESSIPTSASVASTDFSQLAFTFFFITVQGFFPGGTQWKGVPRNGGRATDSLNTASLMSLS